MAKQKRAVIYARVSGDDSGKEGRNLAGQLDMGREYAIKRGYSIVAELSEDDKGASGAEINLPRLNQIREMARASEFDVLIVREIDRLSRNLAKQLIVESELKRAGAGIEYVIGEYADTPEGNFMKHVRASVAEFEREKIRERAIRGRRLKVQSGSVIVAKHPPYGYNLVKQGDKFLLEINEAEAAIVRQVYHWYAIDLLSYCEIGRRLHQMRPPLPKTSIRSVGTRWGAGSVQAIIIKETYAGRWHYGKRNHRDQVNHPRDHWLCVNVPSIVDEDLWQAAQARRNESKKRRVRFRKHERLLHGRLECGKCGRLMTSNVFNISESYPVTQPTYTCRTCSMSVKSSLVDNAVWAWAKAVLCDPEKLREGHDKYLADKANHTKPINEELELVQNLIKEHSGQHEKLLDLYLSGIVSKDDLAGRKVQLEKSIKSLEVRRDELLDQLQGETIFAHHIESLKAFALGVESRIKTADNDFAERQRFIEMLDVTGRYVRDDSGKSVLIKSVITDAALWISSKTNCSCDNRSRLLF